MDGLITRMDYLVVYVGRWDVAGGSSNWECPLEDYILSLAYSMLFLCFLAAMNLVASL